MNQALCHEVLCPHHEVQEAKILRILLAQLKKKKKVVIVLEVKITLLANKLNHERMGNKQIKMIYV